MAGVLDELLQNVRQNDSDWKNAKNAIVLKGVPVPDGTPTSEYGEKILSIEAGVDTSGDTVVPSAMREGYTAHDAEGNPITGTIPNYDGAIVQGAVEGAQAKYEEGVADGKKAEYDAFWDSFQGYKDNSGAFSGRGWNNETFRPKNDIVIESSSGWSTFYMNGYEGDLVELAEELGIKVTFNLISGDSTFRETLFTRLPPVTLLKSYSTGLFRGSTKLHTVDKLTIAETVNGFSYFFMECYALENLIVEGTIAYGNGSNSFNTSWSHKLSKASIISIVNALSDTTTGLIVIFSMTAVNTAFETSAGAADGSTSDEWTALVATKPNWTINLINS